jgi:hypothetical protein
MPSLAIARKAFAAEHHAEKGDVVISPEAWALIKDVFTAKEVLQGGSIKLDLAAGFDSLRRRKSVRSAAPHTTLHTIMPRQAHTPGAPPSNSCVVEGLTIVHPPPAPRPLQTNLLADPPESTHLEELLRGYVASAVLPSLNPDGLEDEAWHNEIRNVTVMFVNLVSGRVGVGGHVRRVACGCAEGEESRFCVSVVSWCVVRESFRLAAS